MYEFTYYLYFHYVWIPLFCFYQVIAGAKSDLHYDVFEEETQQRTKKCKLSIKDTNDGHVGLSVSFGSPTESYQLSFSL